MTATLLPPDDRTFDSSLTLAGWLKYTTSIAASVVSISTTTSRSLSVSSRRTSSHVGGDTPSTTLGVGVLRTTEDAGGRRLTFASMRKDEVTSFNFLPTENSPLIAARVVASSIPFGDRNVPLILPYDVASSIKSSEANVPVILAFEVEILMGPPDEKSPKRAKLELRTVRGPEVQTYGPPETAAFWVSMESRWDATKEPWMLSSKFLSRVRSGSRSFLFESEMLAAWRGTEGWMGASVVERERVVRGRVKEGAKRMRKRGEETIRPSRLASAGRVKVRWNDSAAASRERELPGGVFST